MENKQQTEEFSIGNLENQFCITLPVIPEEADFLPRLAAYQAEHDDLPESNGRRVTRQPGYSKDGRQSH